MIVRFAVPAFFLVSVIAPVRSQQAPEALRGSAEMHRLIEALQGTWSIVESDSPGQNSPGKVARGTEKWTASPGGLVLTEEYQNGKDYEYAAIWWDPKAKQLKGLWCAAINDQGCNEFVASWDGTAIVMNGEWELNGVRRSWREVFVVHSKDSFTQTLYVAAPGRERQQAATIRASRVKHP